MASKGNSGSSSPPTSSSSPTAHTPESQSDTSAMEKFSNMLEGLDLEKHELDDCLKVMKRNPDMRGNFELGMKSTLAMKSHESERDLTELNEHVNNLGEKSRDLSHKGRETLGIFLAISSFCKVSYELYKILLKSKSITYYEDQVSKHSPSKTFSQPVRIANKIRKLWSIFSDASFTFGRRLFESGVVQEVSDDVQRLSGKDGDHLVSFGAFGSAVTILMNTAKVPSLCKKFRDLKLVDHLAGFLKDQINTELTMMILMTISYVIEDHQIHLLTSQDSVFELIVTLTKRTWATPDHRAKEYSCEELVTGMAALSVNDVVKAVLVEKGVLDITLEILDKGNKQERLSAAKLLWGLSFHEGNKIKMKENANLMKTLKTLRDSDDRDLSKACKGALMVIEMDKKESEGTKETKRKSSEEGHVMISYCWNEQEKIKKVCDALKKRGYHVWMDIDQMTGSTLDAMALAVQNSAAVLMCMSEGYKRSNNCRLEAAYAFKRKKTIIPLLVQEGYEADGWLGILVGVDLYFNFSGAARYPFEETLEKLVKELGMQGKKSLGDQVDLTDGPVLKCTSAPVRTSQGLTTNLDMEKWLSENNLSKHSCLQHLTGEHVAFLKRRSSLAPEFYHKCVRDIFSGKMDVEDLTNMMEFTTAIEKS